MFDPIVLEFIFGIAIARLMLAGFRLPPALALFALFAGFAVIVSVAPAVENLRVVVWGLPAALIVAGAVSLERDLGHVVPKWLLAMGDASYSLYLSHGFFLAALGATIRLLGWTSPVAEGVTMIAGLAGSAAARSNLRRELVDALLEHLSSCGLVGLEVCLDASTERRECCGEKVPAGGADVGLLLLETSDGILSLRDLRGGERALLLREVARR